MEAPAVPLSQELTYTYKRDTTHQIRSTFAPVGKGRFLVYDEDDPSWLAPTAMWSRAHPRFEDALARFGRPGQAAGYLWQTREWQG